MNVGAPHTTVVLILLIYGQERQSSVSETPQRYPLFLSLTWMATDSRQLGSHCLTLQASRYSSPLTRARRSYPLRAVDDQPGLVARHQRGNRSGGQLNREQPDCPDKWLFGHDASGRILLLTSSQEHDGHDVFARLNQRNS